MVAFSDSAAAELPISRTRKILCSGGALIALMLAAAAPTAGAGPSGGARQPDLRQAKLSQAGRSLAFTLTTAAPVPLARLDRLPEARGGGSPTSAWRCAAAVTAASAASASAGRAEPIAAPGSS
jgi:hypothetical protein